MKEEKLFLLLNNLNQGKRYIITCIFFVIGLISYYIFASFFIGLIFVIIAMLMLWEKNSSTRPKGFNEEANEKWEKVDRAKFKLAYNKIIEISKKPANGAPGLLFIAVIGIVWLSISTRLIDNSAIMSGIFFVILLLIPVLCTGNINYYAPKDLMYSLEQTSKVSVPEDFDIDYYFEMVNNIPVNSKLMIKPKKGDPNFLGIQVQTSLNKAQSSTVPYTYCVLLAKPEFDLVNKVANLKDDPNGKELFNFFSITDETKSGDVSVVVIRKPTTNTDFTTTPEYVNNLVGNCTDIIKSI